MAKKPSKVAKGKSSKGKERLAKGKDGPAKVQREARHRGREPSAGPVMPPPEVDVAQFEQAYLKLEPELRALPESAVVQPNVDPQMAALVAIGVAKTAQEPTLRARFKKLGQTGEYDDKVVDALPDLGMAMWYVRYCVLLDTAGSKGEPPMELASAGFKLRSKMLKVIDYNLDDDTAVVKRVAQIRAGSGYMDLANDLTAVAELYRDHETRLVEDKRRYQAKDETEAKRLASALLGYIGGTVAEPKGGWKDMQARCWTRLSATYDEVRRGGLFLLPGDEGERKFPLLVATTRSMTSSPTPATNAPSPPPKPQGEGKGGGEGEGH